MKRCKPKRNYKVMTSKIRIVIRSFDHPNHESCISCYDRVILIKSPENNLKWKSRKNIWSEKHKSMNCERSFLVKTPCDTGDIRLLGQAKKDFRENAPTPPCLALYLTLRTRGYATWERIKEVSDTAGNLKEWRQSY